MSCDIHIPPFPLIFYFQFALFYTFGHGNAFQGDCTEFIIGQSPTFSQGQDSDRYARRQFFEKCFHDQRLWGNKRIRQMEELNCHWTTANTSANPSGSCGSEMTLRVVLPWGNRVFLFSLPVIGCRLPLGKGPELSWDSTLPKRNSWRGMRLRVISHHNPSQWENSCLIPKEEIWAAYHSIHSSPPPALHGSTWE